MKKMLVLLALAAFIAMGSVAFAGPDDAKWIAQCLKDNANAKVSTEVITKYCTCMNNKMDDNETLSITQWEKKNPKAQKECDKEAGWK